MKIHEHQAKQIFRDFCVAVPRGLVADSPQAAGEAFAALAKPIAVVKARFTPAGAARGRSPKSPRSAAYNWSATAKRPKKSPPTSSATG